MLHRTHRRRRPRPCGRTSLLRCAASFVVLLLLAGACIATVVPAAGAQTTTTPPASQPAQTVTESWALTPAGTDPNQPGNRPTFSYNLAPGAVQDDAFTVWNFGDTQLTFHLYATDAFNAQDGGFTLLTAEQKAKDVGSWISLEQNNLTLPPHSKATLKLKVTVPANATPGDHTAGVLAASTTPGIDSEGKHIILDRRTGSRVYLRVSGPTTPALTVENLATDYHPSVNPLDGSLDVTYTVRNAGNVRLGAHQKVTVKDLFGTVTARSLKDLEEILPGNAVTVTQHFDGVSATVRVGADVALKPFIPKASGVAVAAKLETATSSTRSWAIPWLLVIVLLVLVAVIVLVRRRRAAAPGGPAGPSDFDRCGGPVADPGVVPAEPVGAYHPHGGTGGLPLQ